MSFSLSFKMKLPYISFFIYLQVLQIISYEFMRHSILRLGYRSSLFQWFVPDNNSIPPHPYTLSPQACFRRRAVLRRARTFSYSTAQIDVKNHFLGVLGRAVLNAFERRAARFSTASARRLK